MHQYSVSACVGFGNNVVKLPDFLDCQTMMFFFIDFAALPSDGGAFLAGSTRRVVERPTIGVAPLSSINISAFKGKLCFITDVIVANAIFWSRRT